jgi:hypothetical protein
MPISADDRTPLAELRKNFVAALAVLIVVGFGALCVVILSSWF